MIAHARLNSDVGDKSRKDVKTRSSVFIDAGRVGSATCCLRAWSSIRSNNQFIRGGGSEGL